MLVFEEIPDRFPLFRSVVGVLLVGILGCGVTILIFTIRGRWALGLLLCFAVIISAYFSGNARSFLLVCLVLAIPLDLSKFFKMMPHMGGEYALRLEASDPFLLGLLLLWVRDLYAGRISAPKIPLSALMWIILIILGLFYVAFGLYRTQASYEIIRMMKMLMLFILLTNMLKRPRQVEIMVSTMIFMLLIQSSYGVMQNYGLRLGLERLGESSQLFVEQIGSSGAKRIGAMLGHPNMFASYLVMMLPLSFAILFSQVSLILKLLSAVSLLMGELALLFTMSRGGWIGCTIGLFIVALMSFVHPSLSRRYFLLKLFVSLAVILIIVFSIQPILQRFTLSQTSNVTGRLALMKIAWGMIESKPHFGVGLNSFTFVMNEFDHTGLTWDKMPQPVHNIYLLVWAEQGTYAFLALIILLMDIIRKGIASIWRRKDFMVIVSIGLLGGLIGIMVQGLVDWTLRINNIQRVFFLVSALLAAVYYMDRQDHARCLSAPLSPVKEG